MNQPTKMMGVYIISVTEYETRGVACRLIQIVLPPELQVSHKNSKQIDVSVRM